MTWTLAPSSLGKVIYYFTQNKIKILCKHWTATSKRMKLEHSNIIHKNKLKMD